MPRGYARYVLGVMVGINFLNYLDRYILPSVVTKIQAEFHLTDSQVGLLGSAFLLVYAVATIPFGIWADRGVRKTVVGVGVTIWSLATLFTGLARSYAQLFIARAVLGIGEASYYPAGTALLGDYFRKEGRGRPGAGPASRITPRRNHRRPPHDPSGCRQQSPHRPRWVRRRRRLCRPGPADAQPSALRPHVSPPRRLPVPVQRSLHRHQTKCRPAHRACQRGHAGIADRAPARRLIRPLRDRPTSRCPRQPPACAAHPLAAASAAGGTCGCYRRQPRGPRRAGDGGALGELVEPSLDLYPREQIVFGVTVGGSGKVKDLHLALSFDELAQRFPFLRLGAVMSEGPQLRLLESPDRDASRNGRLRR